MINKFTFCITLLLFVNLNAQIPKLKDIQNLKSSKVIIGLTGNQDLDNDMQEMIKGIWNICEIDSAIPLKQALSKASQNKDLFVLYLGSMSSRSFGHEGSNGWKYNEEFYPFLQKCCPKGVYHPWSELYPRSF